MKVITKDKLNKMWGEIISTKTSERPIFLISDVDGTLVETDPSLIKAVRESRYCSFMIATGRPVDERRNSKKFQGRESLGTNCPIIIGQGGSVTCVNTGSSENFYIVPIQHDMEELVDTIAEGLGVDRKTLFREEMLCMHYFSDKEIIAIPIASEDELDVARILEQYEGNIVDAVKAKALPCYDIAIREYLERGKPEWEIVPLYERDIPGKLYTELTIVGPDLEQVKKLLWERFEISIGIQHQIADRYVGTRFCDDYRHPDIADVTSCTKQDHVKEIIDVVREKGGITIGLGDQYNDDHLTVTDYSFVADADGAIASSSAWNFAIEMAKKADDLCKRGTKVIHAEHKDNLLINWAVKAIIEAAEEGGFEATCDLLESLADSKENLAKRKELKESTK